MLLRGVNKLLPLISTLFFHLSSIQYRDLGTVSSNTCLFRENQRKEGHSSLANVSEITVVGVT